ncbi:MAG TPA: dolichyl-phosphate beta-glucosyltransferase [Bryobacteraceae bacterium]|nr:dolichyl-phosphate beta-glucosyltransferase [Bryobacteraceae bacterium]
MIRSVSIIIPAYNEAKRLPDTMRRILQYLQGTEWIFNEILVVDDGSTDNTTAVVEEFANEHTTVRVLRNPGNRGKGYSVRRGMLEAAAEWCLLTDADLSTPIEELEKLWCAITSGKDVIAIGSRAIDRSLIGVHQPGHRETMGRLFNGVMRVMTGLPIADTQCGFKLFRADVAREIFSRQKLERFGFDAEILYIAFHLGYGIAEVPVRWDHVEGSKVGMLTGLHAFGELLQIRANSLRGKYK